MVKKAVTFIIRVFGNKAQAIGCINSIYRQSNKAFEVVVITDNKEFKNKLEEMYEDIKVIKTKKSEKFSACNKLIKELETEYFVFTNKDSVYTPNTVDEILKEESDCVIYNISRINKNGKFTPLCPVDKELDLKIYINTGVSVWNNAFRTRFIVDNGILINDIDYLEQLIYLLKIYSQADKIRVVQQVLLYREKLIKPKEISFEQFYNNRKVLSKVLKQFNKKGLYDVSKKIIADFVFDNVDAYYKERNFFRKMLIRYRIRKYICI